MKPIFLKALLATAVFISVSAMAGAQGFLRVSGKLIANDNTNNFRLRGIGIGGFMLQEGYMFNMPRGQQQQHKIKARITELVGEEKTAEFYDKWLKNFLQKEDIDSLKSWGFNSIRLPMHYRYFTLSAAEEPVKGKNTWLPKGFEVVDSLLSWCGQDHIYLILDLHAAPGGQGNDLNIADRDPSQPSLWQLPANEDKTVALWKELARRYGNKQWIGGYDILNETNWSFSGDTADAHGIKEKNNAPLRNLFMRITKAIRSEDKNHIIFLEGNGFANNYSGIFPLWDKNTVISFHKYWNPNTQEAIQKFLDYREKYNVPLWLGESGENNNEWFADCIGLMEKNSIGWSWWPLKKMGKNNPLQIKKPEDYQIFLDYCAGKGDKPDEQQAEKILNEWLENIKVQNNIFHADVIEAMFRNIAK